MQISHCINPTASLWQNKSMTQTFGMESPRAHNNQPHRQPARYLMLIDSGGSMVARMFLESRELVAEFDAAVEEVSAMTNGLVPEVGALSSEWDRALQGHTAIERAGAMVYTLAI